MTQINNALKIEICEPHKESLLSRISICLIAGMEAVLVPDREGVVCAPPKKGFLYLYTPVEDGSDKPRYPNPHQINVSLACDEKRIATAADKRLLPSSIVKDIIRAYKDKIDPFGIRIIGGVYCDGLNLNGLDLPYSLILDGSVFNNDVEVRNFRSSGDLSFDNAVAYKKLGVSRATISGSLWGQVAFFKRLEIENSTIGGSVRLNGSVVASTMMVDSASISGDLDASASYFSNLEILRNNIGHVLDLGQSQARCSFDIRKNTMGDVVAVQFGFGEIAPVEGEIIADGGKDFPGTDAETDDVQPSVRHERFRFKRITNDANFGRPLTAFPKDPYDRYTEPQSGTSAIISRLKQCESPRSIRQGAVVLIDNRIKSSLCIRSFNWPTDIWGRTRKGNIYLNEAVVGGGTWLNLTRQTNTKGVTAPARNSESAQDADVPELNIFNVSTGTLVLNFDLTEQDIALKVNGLHFERIYASQEPCEAALSLRAGKPRAQLSGAVKQPSFPPILELPTAEQVTTWINKNKFARTQQPFAEFVRVFEKAGNSEVATELKIRASNFELSSSSCSLLPTWMEHKIGWCAGENGASGGKASSPSAQTVSWFGKAVRWLEQLLVAIFQFFLGVLADYGYRPERIIWWVIGTVAAAWVFFRYILKIVAFGVEGTPERIRPLGLVFLFDRLLPAYRIREENYRIDRFFRASDAPEAGKEVKCFNRRYKIVEASPRLQEWAELTLDALKFIGFVFAIFVVAAIGRLSH